MRQAEKLSRKLTAKGEQIKSLRGGPSKKAQPASRNQVDIFKTPSRQKSTPIQKGMLITIEEIESDGERTADKLGT